jgi:membrane protein insertase Oxa1/YidC/SpoIIIJ
VYWIVSNVLSIGQQIVINDILKKRRAVLAAAAPAPVIAPNRKPTKNKKK